jgi:hypothetical protein
MPVMRPTSLEFVPLDFNRILWQRIRKQWLLPDRSPSVNSCRCLFVNVGVFTRPIMQTKIKNNLN